MHATRRPCLIDKPSLGSLHCGQQCSMSLSTILGGRNNKRPRETPAIFNNETSSDKLFITLTSTAQPLKGPCASSNRAVVHIALCSDRGGDLIQVQIQWVHSNTEHKDGKGTPHVNSLLDHTVREKSALYLMQDLSAEEELSRIGTDPQMGPSSSKNLQGKIRVDSFKGREIPPSRVGEPGALQQHLLDCPTCGERHMRPQEVATCIRIEALQPPRVITDRCLNSKHDRPFRQEWDVVYNVELYSSSGWADQNRHFNSIPPETVSKIHTSTSYRLTKASISSSSDSTVASTRPWAPATQLAVCNEC